jgi:HPt (histidine-containing phosphotransfer) domain-containing protein
MMLSNFESMTLTEQMKKIVEPYDNLKYEEVKDVAHGLKGASGYIGAGRLHYVCYFIQENFVYNRLEKEIEFYPSLVEAAIEFKTHSRMLIEKNQGKSTHPQI